MLNNIFKYRYSVTLLILLIGTSCSLFAQKERIILVPYTRFQFVSEFSLEEIATHNDISATEVFNEYQQGLSAAFTELKNDDIEFIPIKAEAYAEVKKYIRYNEGKFEGRKYNASNLSLFPNEEYKQLLEKHNASAILFVNWYVIQKSVHTVYMGDRNKRKKYSTHLLDYDVYNEGKVKVIGKGRVSLFCGDFPPPSVIEHKSLNVKELNICYTDLLKNLVPALMSTPQE